MRPQIQDIIVTTARYFNLTDGDLCSPCRKRRLARPRQIAMYLCRILTDASTTRIGGRLGGRDHTTVLHACWQITALQAEDHKIKTAVQAIQGRVTADFIAAPNAATREEIETHAAAEFVACKFLEWIATSMVPAPPMVMARVIIPAVNRPRVRMPFSRPDIPREYARPHYLPLPQDFRAPDTQLMMRGR